MTVFCLIHGSAQTSEVWDRLVPELNQRGFETVVPKLPAHEGEAGARRYAGVVADALKDVQGDVIAVAHSASGLLLPVVTDARPVNRMVFLAGAIPKVGVSFLDQMKADRSMFNPEWPGQDPSTDDAAAMKFILHDCDPDAAKWGLTVRSPWYPEGLYAEVCPLTSWPDMPSSYIVCSDDRTFRPEWARRAAREQLGVEPLEIPGGHCPQISRPADLAALLSTLDTIES
jgi:pimeloyl-ACP methyl ester carboxylesterase